MVLGLGSGVDCSGVWGWGLGLIVLGPGSGGAAGIPKMAENMVKTGKLTHTDTRFVKIVPHPRVHRVSGARGRCSFRGSDAFLSLVVRGPVLC